MRRHFSTAQLCTRKSKLRIGLRLLGEILSIRSKLFLMSLSRWTMFYSFCSRKTKKTTKLGYNVMKGTEYFVSL